MCSRCPGLITELVAMDPDNLTEERAWSVLWNETAFPFSDFEYSAQQARVFVAGVVASRKDDSGPGEATG